MASPDAGTRLRLNPEKLTRKAEPAAPVRKSTKAGDNRAPYPEAAMTTRKQRANFRRVAYFIAHCLAFALLPQHFKAPVFAVASLAFCFLWISHRRISEYWNQEWGYRFLDQVSHVQSLYPDKAFAEDILRGYIKAGLERDEARIRAK